MVAFLNCKKEFIGYKPMNPACPGKLESLGDHLRKVRLDRGLYQSDVAKALGVTNDSINNWENNHCEPRVSQAKRIIEFLGYVPYDLRESTLGMRLFIARQVTGLSHRKVSKLTGLDTRTIALIELGRSRPFMVTKERCEKFIRESLNDPIE